MEGASVVVGVEPINGKDSMSAGISAEALQLARRADSSHPKDTFFII
ncbi:MAG: hypothetical protein AAF609_03085 [Cyanobacteria bacterium P01_C01_bin.120]